MCSKCREIYIDPCKDKCYSDSSSDNTSDICSISYSDKKHKKYKKKHCHDKKKHCHVKICCKYQEHCCKPKPCPCPCPPPPPCIPAPKSTIFKSRLSGKNEVPPNCSCANGTLVGLLSPDRTRFDFALQTNGLNNIIGAHIHEGGPGVNGPIVKTLNIDPITGSIAGLWTVNDVDPLTPALAQKLLAGCLYVNVHTVSYPNGEIRDQIWPLTHKKY